MKRAITSLPARPLAFAHNRRAFRPASAVQQDNRPHHGKPFGISTPTTLVEGTG